MRLHFRDRLGNGRFFGFHLRDDRFVLGFGFSNGQRFGLLFLSQSVLFCRSFGDCQVFGFLPLFRFCNLCQDGFFLLVFCDAFLAFRFRFLRNSFLLVGFGDHPLLVHQIAATAQHDNDRHGRDTNDLFQTLNASLAGVDFVGGRFQAVVHFFLLSNFLVEQRHAQVVVPLRFCGRGVGELRFDDTFFGGVIPVPHRDRFFVGKESF